MRKLWLFSALGMFVTSLAIAATVKISEMPGATTVGSSDIIPIVQAGVNKKATISQITNGLTAADILTKIKTVDGSGSGLDADTLDTFHAATFAQISSATLTGHPTAPTAVSGTNTNQLATTAFVQSATGEAMPSPPAWSLSKTSSAIRYLKNALSDPFHEYVNIRLIGDSITWGMITTGQADPNTPPRAHSLADNRNNFTSPCWANLLRDYLGQQYAAGSVITDAPGAGHYEKEIDLYFNQPGISYLSAAGATLSPVTVNNAGHEFGQAYTIINSAGITYKGIEFDFYGDNFTLVYAQVAGYASYNLYVDAALVGTYTTAGSTAFNVTRQHTFTLGQHHIRIENASADTVTGLVLEGLRYTKKIAVNNDGIVGTSSAEWLPTGTLLTSSVSASDEFVFCMIGTNDRSLTTAPYSYSTTAANVSTVVKWLQTQGKRPVIMAANAVTQSESGDKFLQSDVAWALSGVASYLDVDMINHWPLTATSIAHSNVILSDGLHPNDAGHALLYSNIINTLGMAATQRQDSSPIKTQVYTAAFTGVATGVSYQTFTLPFAQMPLNIISTNMRVKLTADSGYGSMAYFNDATGATGGARNDGGTYIYINTWIARMFNQTGTNTTIGINNTTGSTRDVTVEITLFYI